MRVIIDVDVDVDNHDPDEILEEIEEALRDIGFSARVDFYEED